MFSIAGSGHCVILLSFIKLWVGTTKGLQAFRFCVPTRQEDVLISLGPEVALNLLTLLTLNLKLRRVDLLHLFFF